MFFYITECGFIVMMVYSSGYGKEKVAFLSLLLIDKSHTVHCFLKEKLVCVEVKWIDLF